MTFENELRGGRDKVDSTTDSGLSQEIFGAQSRGAERSIGTAVESTAAVAALPAVQLDASAQPVVESEKPTAPTGDVSNAPKVKLPDGMTEQQLLPGKTPRDEVPSTPEGVETTGKIRPEFPGPPGKIAPIRDEKVVVANRANYKEEVEKQVQAASVSLPAEKGEGYADVLHRMNAKLSKEELQTLAAEAKQANGGKELKPGDKFNVMSKEQSLRLVDQVMNEYDARHNTDALDIHGDFAPEKGKMAAAHNDVRAGQKEKMQAALDEFEKKLPSEIKKPDAPPKPANVKMTDFALEAQTLLPKLDLNHDSNLSHDELVAASQNEQFKGKDKQTIAGLMAGEDWIKELNNDRLGKEKGISVRDLQKLDQKIHELEGDFRGAFRSSIALSNEKLFDTIDTNNDSLLSKKELKEALQNRDDLRPWERSAIRYSLENVGEIEEISNDEFGDENSGISKKDVEGLLKHVTQSDDATAIASIEKSVRAARPPRNNVRAV